MANKRLWKSTSYVLLFVTLTLLFFKSTLINKLFFTKTLFIIVLISLLAMLAILLLKRSKKTFVLRKNLGSVTQPLLIPIIAAPLFKCSFKVPYLFCQVCPTKCPFGHLQSTILSSSVLMNIESRNWCSNVCPVGKLQDSLSMISQNLKLKQINLTKHKITYRIINIIGYSFLAFFLYTLFSILISPERFTTIISIFQTPRYSLKLGSLIILAIVLLSLYIPRLWCNHFCPVGTIWKITRKFERDKKSKNQKG